MSWRSLPSPSATAERAKHSPCSTGRGVTHPTAVRTGSPGWWRGLQSRSALLHALIDSTQQPFYNQAPVRTKPLQNACCTARRWCFLIRGVTSLRMEDFVAASSAIQHRGCAGAALLAPPRAAAPVSASSELVCAAGTALKEQQQRCSELPGHHRRKLWDAFIRGLN